MNERQTVARGTSPLAMVGFMFSLVALIGPWFLGARPLIFVLLAVNGVLLGLLGGGFRSFGIAAILVGGYVVVGYFLVPVVYERPDLEIPALEEPVPIPSGYGFTLIEEDSDDIKHVYEGTVFENRERAAERAVPEVLEYYRRALVQEGWVLASIREDGVLVFKDPGSDRGLHIVVYLGGTPDSTPEDVTPTLILSIWSRSCPKAATCG